MKNKSWDEFWKDYQKPSNAEKWLIRERKRIINEFIGKLQKSKHIKILEVGCGYASNSRLLSANKNIQVFCIDSSKEVINKVKRDIKNSYVGNARNMTMFKNNFFDVIFSAGLLEHFKDPSDIVNEMTRILKKGGLLITFVPGKYSLWQIYKLLNGENWQHGYEEPYTIKKLRGLFLKNKFELVKAGGLDPFSINGILLKVFNFKLPFKKSLPNAYTEIYSIEEKL
jgi:ubiquinone/menaquinone biosynthesis C-methylase UbiE